MLRTKHSINYLAILVDQRLKLPKNSWNTFWRKDLLVPDIATMLTVSVRTVRCQMSEYGITSSRSFGNISDDDLCRIIRDIRETWPKSGYRIVQGCLRARGLGSNTSELEV